MKINFGDYTYFNPDADDKRNYNSVNNVQKQKYSFDQNKFNMKLALKL